MCLLRAQLFPFNQSQDSRQYVLFPLSIFQFYLKKIFRKTQEKASNGTDWHRNCQKDRETDAWTANALVAVYQKKKNALVAFCLHLVGGKKKYSTKEETILGFRKFWTNAEHGKGNFLWKLLKENYSSVQATERDNTLNSSKWVN